MKKHKALRFALLACQTLLIVILLVRTGAEQDRRLSMLIASAFLPLYIVSMILSANLASLQNRMVGGWIAGSIFVPVLCPLILAFLPSRPAPSRPTSVQSPRVKSGTMSETGPHFNEQGFCTECIDRTSDESCGNVNTFNGIGTALMGTRWFAKGLDPCPICGSVVQAKWFTFGFGISKLGTYRVIYLKQGIMSSRFFARRLLSDYEPVG